MKQVALKTKFVTSNYYHVKSIYSDKNIHWTNKIAKLRTATIILAFPEKENGSLENPSRFNFGLFVWVLVYK